MGYDISVEKISIYSPTKNAYYEFSKALKERVLCFVLLFDPCSFCLGGTQWHEFVGHRGTDQGSLCW